MVRGPAQYKFNGFTLKILPPGNPSPLGPLGPHPKGCEAWLPGTREPRAGYVPEGRELAALFPGNESREHVEPWALLTLSLDPFLARERSAHQAEG